MTRELAQLVAANMIVAVEQSCVAVRGSWDCTGGHGAGCPKGRPYCAIMLGRSVLAKGDAWEEAIAALRAKFKVSA